MKEKSYLKLRYTARLTAQLDTAVAFEQLGQFHTMPVRSLFRSFGAIPGQGHVELALVNLPCFVLVPPG